MYLRQSVKSEEQFPLDTVHNYYERLVFNEIHDRYGHEFEDENSLADMACIALNDIPPRYIRYDIDMSFYMSPEEYRQTQQKVQDAVRNAYKRVKQFQRKTEQELSDINAEMQNPET